MTDVEVDPVSLRTLLTFAGTVSDECQITSDDSGWHVAMTDPAHVAMIRADLSTAAFGPSYEPCGTFRFKPADILPFIGDAPSLTIDDGSLSVRSGVTTRRTRLLEPDDASARVPSMDLTVGAILDSDLLRPAIGAFPEKRMSRLDISASPEGFSLAVGDERDSVDVSVPADDMVSLVCDSPALAHYPLGYWASLMRALPKGVQMELSFDTDYPCSVTVVHGCATLTWLCAPVIMEG